MTRAIALGLLLGGCAALQQREDQQTYDAHCTDGARTEPLCSDLEARRGVAAPEDAPSSEPSGTCCKVCRGSQACGNSCISYKYTCHQPPGCAC
jgi:hypothetical protein